ncbi:MAG: selenocysteine-specific translation elongation factor [Actinobacteria bacterium]|nr:MAG: selenocysteine-specific translation elongation factor [Actinomycetota bacterium]
MALTVGTAGHIDHGKTWLVRALTGKDTDRLPEEKARGISIDLGYAPLDLPGGRRLSVIDVPGHERFIRNMVAGASGIDLFLLVIDATEGARPQTHEHLAILRLLGIDAGVVAVTKADAADPAMLELVTAEARELVPNAPVVPVSAKTGDGLDELRSALAAAADEHERGTLLGATRLYVDRVFTLRGIGTVVTGTLWSGSIGEGDELRAEPAGLDVRVRSVQVHDQPVTRAEAGQRVAVALPGVERNALHRGDALVEPGAYPVSYRLDIELEELEAIPDHAPLQLHHGTAELPARLVRVGERFAQLRLAGPVVAARDDHVLLRAATTVGGGRVLDPAPPRAPDRARLELLATDDPVSIVGALVHEPVLAADLAARALLSPSQLAEGLGTVEQAGDWYFSREWLEQVRREARTRLTLRAEAAPLDPGLPAGDLLPGAPWAEAILPLLELERRGGKVFLPGTAAALGDKAEEAEALEAKLEEAGLSPVRVDDGDLARFLEAGGRLVRVGDGLAVGIGPYEEAKRALIEECERAGKITLARFRDLLGISRRPAQLLLERFDADGLTRRVGDERVLRRTPSRR